MKFILFATTLIFALSSFADVSILRCRSNDVRAPMLELSLADDRSGNGIPTINLIFDDESMNERYATNSSFTNIRNRKGDTFVGTNAYSQNLGNGSYSKAVLVRVSEGSRKAFVAVGGGVYQMTTCGF